MTIHSLIVNNKYKLYLVSLFLIEYLLFRTYVLRDVLPYYPINHDQVVSLADSYRVHENILKDGFVKGIAESELISSDRVTGRGFLFPLQAALLYFLITASRLSALTVNYFYFISLQAFSYKTIADLSGKPVWGFAFVGLLLMLNMPFFWAGGMMDFRMDFSVACLYGILVAMGIRSNVFLDKKWIYSLAILSVYLIFIRYIALVYIVCVGVLLITYNLCMLAFNKRPEVIKKTQIRLKNIFTSSIIISVIVAPVFWFARGGIYSYYIVGHVLGPEKNIRAIESGTDGFLSNIHFYLRSLFMDHLGMVFVMVSTAIVIAGVFVCLTRNKIENWQKKSVDVNVILFFLMASIAGPLLTLLLDRATSPVVIGIISVPVLWITFLMLYSLINAFAMSKKVEGSVAASMMVSGLLMFMVHFCKHDTVVYRKDSRQVTQLYSDLNQYILQSGIAQVVLAADSVTDVALFRMLQIFSYEHEKKWVNAIGTDLGDNIHSITDEQCNGAMQQANVLMINPEGDYPESPYPFYESMSAYRSLILQQLKNEWLLLNDYHFDGYHTQLYVKPDFEASPFGNDKTLEAGLILSVPALVFNRSEALTLSGKLRTDHHTPLQVVTTLLDPAYGDSILNSYVNVDNGLYVIHIDIPHFRSRDTLMHISIQLYEGADHRINSIPLLAPDAKTVILATDRILSPQFQDDAHG